MASRRRAGDGPDPVLSERQQRILDFIEAYAERHGVSPSFREIGDAVGLKAISAVNYQVERLQEKGFLARRDRMPRTIVAKPRRLRSIAPDLDGVQADPGSDDMVSLPLFESVAAGTGLDANPDAVGTIRLPGTWWVTETCSRSGCRAAPWSARTSSTATAWWSATRTRSTVTSSPSLEDEGVVKTFRRTESHVWLMPENPSYDPILGDGCRIMGKVVATLHGRRDRR